MVHSRFSKVFGIGLPKTGTTTLGAMLRRLGYAHAPYDTGLIGRVADGDMSALWPQIERYDSFEDWPWPTVYKEVDAARPGSAFVLTLRKDDATWLRSAQKHQALKEAAYGRTPPLTPGPASRLANRFMGTDDAIEHPDRLCEFYHRHADDVRRHFRDRPEQLIEVCWETGSGWSQLCAFLECPVVTEPLPHENSSVVRARNAAWFPRKIRRLMRLVGR